MPTSNSGAVPNVSSGKDRANGAAVSHDTPCRGCELGSRYATGHVGPSPDDGQTRVRACGANAQGHERSPNRPCRVCLGSVFGKLSASTANIVRAVSKHWSLRAAGDRATGDSPKTADASKK